MLDANHSTQYRTFYIETGNDTNDNSYKQLYNGVVEKLPANSFVAFARTKDNVRIGAIRVHADGEYSLNLRSEYDFGWTNEAVEFDYKISDKIYTFEVQNLNTLFNNPNVVLKLAD